MPVMTYSKQGQKPVQIGVGPCEVEQARGQAEINKLWAWGVYDSRDSLVACAETEAKAQWLCDLINAHYDTDNAQHFAEGEKGVDILKYEDEYLKEKEARIDAEENLNALRSRIEAAL